MRPHLKRRSQTKHAQKAFAQDVKSLTTAIEDIGNPFSENSY
jgi:hypothetical protein